jgi:hypothetical protein
MNTVGMGDKYEATIISNTGNNASYGLAGSYEVKCHDKDGNLKWEETFDNRVVNVGLGLSLNGSLTNTAQGPVYMGLKSVGTAAAADTMTSHSTWTEITAITAGVRSTVSFTAVSGQTVTMTSPAQSFVINTNSTVVAGCFLVTGSGATNVIGATTGTLFSAGDFSSSKTLNNLDTLSVTYSVTASSA